MKMYRAKREIHIRLNTVFEGQIFILEEPNKLPRPLEIASWSELYDEIDMVMQRDPEVYEAT